MHSLMDIYCPVFRGGNISVKILSYIGHRIVIVVHHG